MSIRAHFPILEQKVYLNSCSHGALSIEVREAFGRYLDDWDERGADWAGWMDLYESVRGRFGELLNAQPAEIAITSCASAGVNAVVSALDFGGSRRKIVVSDLDFPTVAQICHAQEPRGVRVCHVPERDGQIPLEAYEQVIDEHTLLVAIASVCYRNGSRQDARAIAEIAHRKGALVLLDAYQAIGTFGIDVKDLDVDFLVAGTLKYLLSSSGQAMLYVRRELLEQLTPTHSGWFAQRDMDAMDLCANDPAPSARRFEAGTPSVANLYATLAGLGLIQSAGLDTIETKIRQLTGAIQEGALSAGFQLATPLEDGAHGALMAIRARDEHAMVEALARDDIVTSCRDGNLRISPHFYNNLDDIGRLLEGLQRHRQFLR